MKNGWRVRTEPATGAALDLARRLLYGCLSRYDTGEAGGEIVCRDWNILKKVEKPE